MEINSTKSSNESISHANGALGGVLKAERERQKISLSTVAAELFIKERQLEALEGERFYELPQYTFCKGFVVKYAKFLGLDSNDIVRRFNAVFPDELMVKKASDIHAPLKPMGTLHRDNKRKITFNPWLLVAVCAVIALAVFFMRVVSNAEEKHNAPEPVQEGINIIEQQQGASLDTPDGIGSSGSALSLGDSANADSNDSTQ